MTEITDKNVRMRGELYAVNPIAFVAALILAPLLVTGLTFWSLIGLFAPIFGAIPYLLIGTPILIWAVGRFKPRFGTYAWLGLVGNGITGLAYLLIFTPIEGWDAAREMAIFVAGFGLVFAPLYAGSFGALYARFHPNFRLLKI